MKRLLLWVFEWLIAIVLIVALFRIIAEEEADEE
jgi:hypothetical protein